jgi:hypothetical protein
MGTEIVYVEQLPPCAVHLLQRDTIDAAHYDAQLEGSTSWAYLCEACFLIHGAGLGTGRGQRLVAGPPPVQDGSRR